MSKINKEGWEIKSFEKIVIKLPKAKQVKTDVYDSGSKYPIISQEETYISGYCDDESMLFRIDRPVVIFGDHTRVLKYVDFDFVVGADGVKIIMPIEELDAKLLYYYLKWYNVPSLGYSRHYKLLKELNIPLPPLPIQQRIVEELDEINAIISAKKQQLSKLDELAQSIFYNMFGDPVANEKGWEVKRLGLIANVKVGPFGSMLHKEDYIAGGIPLVNPMHMKDFKIVVDTNFTVSKEKAKELANYLLKENDVVFARRGDIGRCVIVAKAEEGFLCGTGSLFVRFTHEIASTYIMYLVRSSSFTKELTNKAQGQTMLNLNSSIVENLQIPLPPLPLQEAFAARVSAIEEEKSSITASIEKMQTLLDARMQEYFG